ncbi:Kelch repeat-containing protein [Pustulibacterium marinum]|nr:carboxypeptidase-like regulatory domain-containing protein [Pustulibacterium marinum]
MGKILTLLCMGVFWMYANPIFAQDIQGVVLNVLTDKPVADVYIFSEGDKLVASTNADGEFQLLSSLGLKNRSQLIFSHVGFEDYKVDFKDLQEQTVIYLKQIEEQLDEVTLNGKRKLHSRVQYTEIASLKDRLFDFGAVLQGNKIYVDGGNLSKENNAFISGDFNNGNVGSSTTMQEQLRSAEIRSYFFKEYSDVMHVYDIENNSWATLDKKFRKRAYHQMLSYKNNLYMLGGRFYSKNHRFEYLDNMTEVFNIAKDTVILDNTNPHEATRFGAINFKGNFVLFGGSVKQHKNGSVEYSKEVHLFDATSGYWYALKDMPDAKEVNAVLVGDKVYLIGGFDGKELKSIQTFDLKSGEWANEGSLRTAMEYPALAVLGNSIYMFENGILASYNINTKSLKEYYINLQLYGSHMFIYNNDLYIIGGQYRNRGVALPTSKCYKLSLRQLENTKVIHMNTL